MLTLIINALWSTAPERKTDHFVVVCCLLVVKIVVIIVVKITCSCGRGPPFALLFLARAELESSFGFFTVNGWSCVWSLMTLVKTQDAKMLGGHGQDDKMPKWSRCQDGQNSKMLDHDHHGQDWWVTIVISAKSTTENTLFTWSTISQQQ